MKLDQIKEIVDKVPITLLLVGFLGYLGFDYYSFENDDASAKLMKKKEISTLKDANAKLDGKIKELTLFVKSLETKKVELRGLARQLSDVKASLSENIDVPGFMKMVTTEAKKLNLSVLGLKPTGTTPHDFYAEVTFDVGFRGVFVQLVAFLDRLANLTRIIQVDNLRIMLSGSNTSRFVILEGSLQLKVFKYMGSQEDAIGRPEGESNGAQPATSPGTKGNPPSPNKPPGDKR